MSTRINAIAIVPDACRLSSYLPTRKSRNALFLPAFISWSHFRYRPPGLNCIFPPAPLLVLGFTVAVSAPSDLVRLFIIMIGTQTLHDQHCAHGQAGHHTTSILLGGWRTYAPAGARTHRKQKHRSSQSVAAVIRRNSGVLARKTHIKIHQLSNTLYHWRTKEDHEDIDRWRSQGLYVSAALVPP